ncbi:MAG: HAD family hydrolase [Mangrovibacterium sp.]
MQQSKQLTAFNLSPLGELEGAAIIFDLGGVLLRIDPSKTIEAFRALGMPDLIREGGYSYDHQVFLDMEQGRISPDEFREGINELLPAPVSFAEIDAAWNAMLLDFVDERIELVKELRKAHQVFLFSNTNAIHQQCFQEKFFRQYGYAMPALFDEDFYSHEIGLRKPKAEAFQKVLKLAEISASETLFIDDLEANCEAARGVGMQAKCVQADEKLILL